MITKENHIIHGLWIGTELSVLEQLTLRSFVYHGHTFCLWVYEDLTTEIPEGVSIMDANEIIPKTEVFGYKYSNQFGHGKGSVAGFSDIFRYKLLYEKGGWWVDMDVTCLKPFTSTQPYYFRAHHDLSVVGNVMKCPPKSELMAKCYEDAYKLIDANNRDWHLPIHILNNHIGKLELSEFIVDGLSPSDQWHRVHPYIRSKIEIPKGYYFIHWLNEVWRIKTLRKDVAFSGSAYACLLDLHGIPYLPANLNYRILTLFSQIKEALSYWIIKPS